MRSVLDALGREERLSLSREIGECLESQLQGLRRVALYASLPDEVSTDTWIVDRWSRGESVFLPRMRGDGALDFVAVRGEEELVSGAHSIREPGPELVAQPLARLEAVVVPALAFDVFGVRLGRGGGYYDRTFSERSSRTRASAPLLVGVAFGVQRVEALPRAPHDLRVDLIVTDHGAEVPR